MNKNLIVILIVIAVILLAGFIWINNTGSPELNNLAENQESQSPNNQPESNEINNNIIEEEINNNQNMPTATIKTNKGDIVIEFFPEDAPNTVQNFITLANQDFYNGVIFHRVIEGFMIQGGDPTGTGTGDAGYKFADELDPNTESAQRGYVRGTVAMANAGPDTNGSQFFIMHQDTPLPHNYTIFGRVISGMETVDAIATTPTGANDRPVEEVVMESVEIAE